MTTFATLRTTLGIAKEAIAGTPVAQTAAIPLTKFDPAPKQVKLVDDGWRGSMGDNYGMQNGPRSAELSLGGPVFVDTIGYALAGVLGDIATTGASSPFSHKMALLNSGDGQPKTYTLTDTQGGLATRQYAGAKFTECSFKWDVSGLATWDAKALSWISNTAADPTPVFGATVPVPSWLGQLKFGATAVPNVQNAELNFKRASGEPVFTMGAQDPYAIPVGALEVDGKLTFVAIDESPYTAYASGTTPGALSLVFSQGANAEISFALTQPEYDDVKITRGKSYMEWEATFKAVLNSTDVGASGGFGPATVTVINALPTGTFA
jgi:hypothetical protein